MKCPNLVVTYEYGKKGKRRSEHIPTKEHLQHFIKQGLYSKRTIISVEPCEGTVACKVELESDPYYGGVDYSIGIRYLCTKHGIIACPDKTTITHLPKDADSLSKWITGVLDTKTS